MGSSDIDYEEVCLSLLLLNGKLSKQNLPLYFLKGFCNVLGAADTYQTWANDHLNTLFGCHFQSKCVHLTLVCDILVTIHSGHFHIV